MLSPEKQRDTLKWLTRFALRPLAGRNAVFDTIFYDVTALTSGERLLLSVFENPEGAVLVVWPSSAGRTIQRYPRVPAFLAAHGKAAAEADQVKGVVIAGVGSSALGTAALARNVADALEAPVVGIVSGLGLLDVVEGGLGGWFVLGVGNEISRIGDRWVRTVMPVLERTTKGWHEGKLFDSDFYIPGEPASSALADILGSGETSIRYVVGHSKGGLSIWNALEKLYVMPQSLKRPLENVTVVTFGGPVHLSANVLASVGLTEDRYRQFLGSFDLLGWLNCHAHDPKQYTIIRGAGHILNSKLPGHVSVRAVMNSVTQGLPVASTASAPQSVAEWFAALIGVPPHPTKVAGRVALRPVCVVAT